MSNMYTLIRTDCDKAYAMSIQYHFSFFLEGTSYNIYPFIHYSSDNKYFFQDHDGHRMCFCEEDGCNLNGSGMLKPVPFNFFAKIFLSFFSLLSLCCFYMIWSNISSSYLLFSIRLIDHGLLMRMSMDRQTFYILFRCKYILKFRLKIRSTILLFPDTFLST